MLESRVVACVQVSSPITSRYTWKGKPETSEEHRLTMKTRPALRDAALAALRELHPYEIPEVIVVLAETTDAYAAWVEAETSA